MSDTAHRFPEDSDLSAVVELSGAEGDEPMPIVLRSLRSGDDYRRCEELERATWGQDFSECVPAGLMMISQKVGGVAAGAFDSDGGMLGMVYGLTGPRGGRLVHWSHMLAVVPEMRGRGLGKELKLFQRRLVIDRGAKSMLWTFDPLVARNAYLNVRRLGALPIEYLRDVYGDGSSSELHEGLGTDRFLVEWRLDEVDTVPADSGFRDGEAILNVDREGVPLEPPFEIGEEPRLLIEIPEDIQEAKKESADVGPLWRRSTRFAIEGCFELGYEVVGFSRISGRCWYQLERKSA